MNLLEMRTSLRAKAGNPTTAEVPDSTLDRHINTAYLYIAGRYPFTETRKTTSFPTTVAFSRYQVPPDAAAILHVWDSTNRRRLAKLHYRSESELGRALPPGPPRGYIRGSNWIQLIPTPLAEYTLVLDYQATPTSLAADADVPIFPTSWHEGIVIRARFNYYDERGDVGKAIYVSNAWKDWVADKPSELDAEKDDFEHGVEMPELARSLALPWNYRKYDPYFDYRE